LSKGLSRPKAPVGDRIIRISWSRENTRFEARDERGDFLGANQDLVKTIWSAVQMADAFGDAGRNCRVLVEQKDGSFTEEYAAGPIRPSPLAKIDMPAPPSPIPTVTPRR
jgi:hypothetical protein